MTLIFVITAIAGIIPGIFTMLGERAAGSRAIAPFLLIAGIIALIVMCVLTIVWGHHWWYIPILIVEWIIASWVGAAIVGLR